MNQKRKFFTDIAIEKMKKFGCSIFSLQTPFIIYIYNKDFFKCNENVIISHEDIESIVKKSKIPETISDLK
tara:strand:- start:22668 stop:22880 length:213 start_codon:yes stop_codon:yes gene_type:complete